MKKLVYILLLLVSIVAFSQSNTITYQAVIYLPSGQNAPGVDVANLPMTNKNICLQFSFIDANNRVEYQEEIKVKTDEFGMVNITIGNGDQSGGYASSFDAIVWNASVQKNLQVALDARGLCNQFEILSNEPIASVPFANASITASNVSGIVTLANGGTGATTAAAARTNLGIGNVDNTSDLNKPISTATKTYVDTAVTGATIVDASTTTKGKVQLAGDLAGTAALPTVPGLALKENAANKSTTTTLGTSDVLFPTQKAVKTYVDTAITGATIVDADTATKGKIQLAGDLAGTAALPTVPGLALKENAANKSTTTTLGTSNVLFPTQNAVKTYVDTAIAGATIVDADATTKGKIQLAGDLAGTAAAPTVPGLALKLDASLAGVPNGLATLNSAGIIPANQLPPVSIASTNVVGSQAQMLALSNATVGSIAVRTDVNKNFILSTAGPSVLANWVELLTPGAPVQSVNGLTGAIQLSKSDINLANVDNTSDAAKPVSTATQNALNLKLNTNQVGVPNGTASLNALGKIPTDQIPAISFSSVKVLGSQAEMLAQSNALVGSVVIRTDVNKNYVLAQSDPTILANWLELLTPAPPVQSVNGYVGNVSLTKADLGLGNVDNTGDINKPVSTPTQNALDLKANLASPTFTGTVSGITKSMVGLANVDNTTDLNKPVSTPTQNALDLKANLASPTFSGTVSGITKAMVGLGNVDNTTDAAKPVSTATQTALDLKANLASPTFTGTVSGITKAMVGLGNVDNTTDVAKPVSTATQTALDLKANLASPTFTGTVSGIDKTMVGLANVDNTTDAAKPVSTATQTALNLKANTADVTTSLALKEDISNKSTTTTLGTSDSFYPTQKAVKTYVDTAIAGATIVDSDATTKGKIQLAGDLTGSAASPAVATGAITSAKILDGTIANADVSSTAAIAYSKLNLASSIVVSDLANNAVEAAKIKDAAVETTKIKDAAVTYAKIQDVSATNKVLGRVSANAGVVEEIATTGSGDVVRATSPTLVTPVLGAATGTSLSVSGQLTSTVATGTAPFVVTSTTPVANLNIAGNAANVTGTVAIANGGTGATTAAAALTNLGAEPTANKSTATDLGNTTPSDQLFPSQKAVKTYVDAQTAAAGVSDGSITSAKILDGTIAAVDIADNTITGAKLNSNLYAAGKTFTFQNLLVGAGTTFGKISTDGTKYISFEPTYNVESTRFWANGNITIQTGGTFTDNGYKLEVAGTTKFGGNSTFTGTVTGTQFTSTIADGTAPFVVTSTTPVANLSIGGNAATVTNGVYTTSKISDLAATTSAELAGKISDETGTGALVFASSPTLVTPTLGVASATSVGFSGATSGKATLAAPAVAGTTTITLPAATGTLATLAGTETLTNKTLTSPTLTTPDLGIPSAVDLTNALALPLTTGVTGILPVANGGTGSSTKNFVDLTTNQTVAGVKTFSSDIVVNSLTLGRGPGGLESNTVLGSSAFSSNTSGIDSVVLGYQALKNNTTGASNVAIGKDALFANTGGNNNVAIGRSSLVNNTTGISNVAIGLDSALSNTTGNENIAVGQSALRLNTTGVANTAIGRSALSAITTGNYNSALGWQSLAGNTTGIDNVAVGYNAGRYDASGTTEMSTSSFSVYLGASTKGLNATGSVNETVIGNAAVGLGSNSTVIGNSTTTKAAIYGALNLPNTTTSTTATTGALTVGGGVGIAENLNVGGNAKITGTLTVAGGTPGAGKVLTSDANGLGTWTTPAGVTTMAAIGSTPNANGATISGVNLNLEPASATYGGVVTTGAQTFAGAKTFSPAVTAASSLGIGTNFTPTLTAAAIGDVLVGLDINPTFTNGSYTGLTNYGLRVQGIGFGLGGGAVTSNIAIGSGTLINNSTGSNNTGLGYRALLLNSTGIDNTAIGYNAGDKITSGSKNIFVGSSAGSKIATGTTSNATGANSVLIGYDVRPAADGQTNQIVISGYNGTAGTVGLGSNTTLIGSSTTTDTRIMGALDLPNATGSTSTTTGALKVAGGAGIFENLNVGGNTKITGTISIAGGTPGAGKVLTSTDSSGIASWVAPAGVTTMAAIGSTPNANGATISGGNLNLEPASSSFGGIVTTGTQTFAGAKTFSSSVSASSNLARGTIFSPTITAAANNDILVAVDINPTFTNGSFTPVANYGIRVQGIHFGRGGSNETSNIAIGDNALKKNDNSTSLGYNNTAIGSNAMAANTTGARNTAVGKSTLLNNLTGGYNTAIGDESLIFNTVSYNTAVGASSLNANTSGANNTAIGAYASAVNTTGNYNVSLGANANSTNQTGSNNVAIGYQSLYNSIANSNISDNTAVGYQSLGNSTTGNNNTAVGSQSIKLNTSGAGNVAFGWKSLYFNATGNYNTAIGYNSGNTTTTNVLTNGIYIGYNAAPKASTNTDEIVIGSNLTGNGSNTVSIGNSSNTANYLKGILNVAAGTAASSTDGISSVITAQNAGTGGTNAGGSVNITAGNGNSSGLGGNIVLTPGTSTTAANKGIVTVNGQVKIADGTQGAGKVLTSDANGLATWTNASGSAVTTSTAGYVITLAESIVFYTGSAAGTFAIPDPATTNAGKEITIKNKTAFGITITPTSTGKIYIDSANTAVNSVSIGIEASNNWIKLVSDGSQWNVLRALF